MDKVNKVLVGKRIEKIRKSKQLSLEDFGETYFGTSKSTVHNWENGRNLPNIERLHKIAEIGNITYNELLYGTTEEQQQIQNEIELYRKVRDVAYNYLKDINSFEKHLKETSGMLDLLQEIEDKIYEALDKFDSSPNEAKAILSELSYAIENYIPAVDEDLEMEQSKINSAKRQLELANKKLEELNKD